MCEYVNIIEGKCRISKEGCPFTYFCNKTMSYKSSASMPENCNIKESIKIPKGYYKVEFERRGNLYIKVNDFITIVKNPCAFTPQYVKLNKTKSGSWRIKDFV